MVDPLKQRISKLMSLDVLHNIISKRYSLNNPKITKIKLGWNPKKCDSYLCIVTRFSIEAEEDGQKYLGHYTGKGLPSNFARRKTFRSVDFFRNEIGFYEKVWPVLNNFQNCKNIPNPLISIPNCVMTHFDTCYGYVILEDVIFNGYKPLSRDRPLDLEMAIRMITEIARFHAISLSFKHQQPQEFDHFSKHVQETYFVEKYRKWYTPMLLKITIILQDIITDVLPGKYLDKLDYLMNKDLFGEVVKLCKERDDLYGLVHGNCLSPNFLVKQSEDTFDVKITNYQAARCGSVTMDLSFFLYTSVAQEVVSDYWEGLVNEYHCALAGFLKDLDSPEDMITLEMINDSLKRIGMFTFVTGLDSIIMSSVDPKLVADMDTLQVETSIDKAWKLRLITDSEWKDKIAFFFKHIVDQGFV